MTFLAILKRFSHSSASKTTSVSHSRHQNGKKHSNGKNLVFRVSLRARSKPVFVMTERRTCPPFFKFELFKFEISRSASPLCEVKFESARTNGSTLATSPKLQAWKWYLTRGGRGLRRRKNLAGIEFLYFVLSESRAKNGAAIAHKRKQKPL